MKKLLSALFILTICSVSIFAQSSVKDQKAEVKTAKKATNLEVEKKSEFQVKEVKAERVAKTEGIAVQEKAAVAKTPVSTTTSKAVVKNPRLSETDQRVAEKKAEKVSVTSTKVAAEKKNNSPK